MIKKMAVVCLSVALMLSVGISLPGASEVSASGEAPLRWETRIYNNAPVTIEVDSTLMHSGARSLKVTNSSSSNGAAVWQYVGVKPNTKYNLSVWVKAEDVVGAYWTATVPWTDGMTKVPGGTYDWMQLNFSIITKPDQTTAEVRLVVPNRATGGLWADDVEMIEEGTTLNLIRNGGFEESLSDLPKRFDQLEAKLPALKDLLTQTEAAGMLTDYETVNYTVIENFIGFGRSDIANGQRSRAEYVADQLDSMYNEAEQNLKAYLAGSKAPLEVPRYITQQTKIKDYSFIGDTKLSNGQTGKDAERPIFFTGYGHFGQVREDIPKFTGYGTNIIQIENGPSSVLSYPTPFPDWTPFATANAQMFPNTDAAHTGSYSLKIVNASPFTPHVYGYVAQGIAVKPGTTYTLSAWLKASNASKAFFTVAPDWGNRHYVPDGTYDWQKYEFTITTGASETGLTLRFFTEDITDGLWVDDLTLIEQGTEGPNLVKNGGFEDGREGDEPIINTDVIRDDIQANLAKAEQNNIAVNLLLSPHYFPPSALTKWPELQLGNGFLPFNIYDPKAKEIIELYLRTIIPMVKDYKSLHSITLSNEPQFIWPKNDANDQQQWHAYLSEVYSENIGKLNEVYGTGYGSFDEVPIPPLNIAPTPAYYDWMTFNNKRFADWHAWMADIIHEIAPDIPVHAKILPENHQNLGIWPNELSFGVDPELFAEFSQISGNDNYNLFGWGPDGFTNEMKFYDLLGSFKQAPIFNSEDHLIADGDSQYVPGQTPHARATLWQGAIHGRSASTIWVWERTYGHQPSFTGSVLHRPDVVAAVGKTNLDLNRLANEVTAFQEDKARVAVLWSLASKLYSGNYLSAMTKAYAALSLSGQKVDFVSEKQIADGKLDRYKLLVVPEATNVQTSTLNGLKAFADQEGKVVVTIGDNPLGRDVHNQPLPAETRDALLAKAVSIPSSATDADVRMALAGQLDELKLNSVRVLDAATNEPVNHVEWRSVKYGDKLLINVTNYEQADKQVYLEVDGVKAGAVTDLISGEEISSPEKQLKGWTPYLFSINQQQ